MNVVPDTFQFGLIMKHASVAIDWSGPNAEPSCDKVPFELSDYFARLLETQLSESANRIPWDKDTSKAIEQYLASESPKGRLDSISEAAASLQRDIQNHFKVDELLLAAEKQSERRSAAKSRRYGWQD